jgi:hypothetical protein
MRKNPDLYLGSLDAAAAAANPNTSSTAPQTAGQTTTGVAAPAGTTGSYSAVSPAAPAAAAAADAPPPRLKHKPEVLAPAGGWPQLKAAVQSGADAVYFGMTDFSARGARRAISRDGRRAA